MMTRMQKNGFTLIELLAAMALASVVMVVIVSTYTAQVRSQNVQRSLTEMNQTARAALEVMSHEIRLAGLDTLESAGARIDIATAGELVFSMDIRDAAGTNAPNGNCCDPGEQIRYHLTNDADDDGVNDAIVSGVECHLGRETGSGLIAAAGCGGGTSGLQTLALNVDVLNFVYLDANGIPIPMPVANTGTIRAVEVNIVARAGTASEGFFHDFTNTETYFNNQGQQILSSPGDKFRRLQLTTTITCRNL